ncbi:DNA ligase D [Rubrivivax gelatinosus]|uniref:DNA ligase (ATP) n=1 Tax=Rubrivivax gelatinosus (strain NBRC 100245 / IL144) TaxID=983917 RepID=I0HSJ5_RUBGI|nr:DNA ligase D [Rubrivivax gelatinosus]BAL95982.1 ATP-dependent DNA ligase LigD [Rubrivivax gelatinosus IL144]
MPRTAAPARDPLQHYRERRDFRATPEPGADAVQPGADTGRFVIQKHDATRLHYDFRLELDGVLLSWAVPKGPSLDPADRRMAVRTEDHPLAYADFEGRIPAGHYGAGQVIVWDRGSWTPLAEPRAALAAGKLPFELDGEKLHGAWELVRMKPKPGERGENWLLFKKRDAQARPRAEFDVVAEQPDSVAATAADKPRRRQSRAALALDSVAPKAPQPETLAPQLATLASAAPSSGSWLYETKFDGYRLLARIRRGVPRLFTRNGHDWTDKLPALAAALKGLGLQSAWIDGELVALGSRGAADFNALQNAFDGRDTARLLYYVFDLPYVQGRDLRELALDTRRALLQSLLDEHPLDGVRFSEELPAGGAGPLATACERQLEGVIAKRRDAPYRSLRSEAWLKLKCRRRQEFVVAGYTERTNASGEIGSLILAVHDADGRLVHAGKVGTGWDTRAARDLFTRLQPLAREAVPFAAGTPSPGRWSRRAPGLERWVRPEFVVEVEFAEWTPGGSVRHAVFVGVREDKPAAQVLRERAVVPDTAPSAAPTASSSGRIARVRITHGERIVDKASGLSKLDLLRWYDGVAERMLPHLKARPVALLRAPQGVGRPVFFQKHAERTEIPGLVLLDPALWPGHEPLMEIRSAEALLSAAQMNTIEFHTWNATTRTIAKPDRLVFDLDPGEGVDFAAVREGALLVRTLLDELGLASWLKTSGGKGLHVVVPVAPRVAVDVVKPFSRAVVAHLAEQVPERFVVRSGPANRVGRIFVDWLRNGEGATTVAAFSARARPGLGVSIPVSWDALPELRGGDQWTLANAREHLSFEREDPWAAFWTTRQALAPAMRRLGFDPRAGGDGR